MWNLRFYITVFLDVVLRSMVEIYWNFHHQCGWGQQVSWNIIKFLPHYVTSHPRRQLSLCDLDLWAINENESNSRLAICVIYLHTSSFSLTSPMLLDAYVFGASVLLNIALNLIMLLLHIWMVLHSNLDLQSGYHGWGYFWVPPVSSANDRRVLEFWP